ncbi:MAG: HAD family hydrolase [Candidatus Eremiobacteraeota bacterium]|nr:HAD family hydrolase [Candidatus Eremiobacteraeota bacterium]
MKHKARVKGVLLDIDGTLVLSNDAHARAWVEAFAAHGLQVRFEDVRPLIGMGADRVVPALAPTLTESEGVGKEINEIRQRIFLTRYAPDLQPAPGSRELIERLRSNGVRLAIASSAQTHELETLLKVARIEDLVEMPNGGSEGKQSKPSPDVVAASLQRAQLRAEDAFMLGDTPFDILAAQKCGLRTIALRCGGWGDARLRDAAAIYDDPADLLRHYEASPLGASVTSEQHGH